MNCKVEQSFKFLSPEKAVKNHMQEGLQLKIENQFSSVQSLSRVQLFATPWIAAR